MKKLQCLVPIMQAGLYNHLFELSGTRVISFYTSNWKLWIYLHTASLSFTASSGFTILASKYGNYRNLWEIWEALSHKSHTLNCPRINSGNILLKISFKNMNSVGNWSNLLSRICSYHCWQCLWKPFRSFLKIEKATPEKDVTQIYLYSKLSHVQVPGKYLEVFDFACTYTLQTKVC